MAPTATAHRERGVDPAEPFFSAAAPFLDRLALFFEEQKEEFEPELSGLVDYALSHSGKRLRPIALFLTGSGPDGEFTEEMVRAAAVVELVHLATLVHDDILDGADVRHEHETVSRRHGVSAAVLLGDALFAQSLQLASRFPTTEVCRQVSEATRKICAGEIEQTLDGGNDGDGIGISGSSSGRPPCSSRFPAGSARFSVGPGRSSPTPPGSSAAVSALRIKFTTTSST
jgi:geranylgeranyl pyrophosphate synthase